LPSIIGKAISQGGRWKRLHSIFGILVLTALIIHVTPFAGGLSAAALATIVAIIGILGSKVFHRPAAVPFEVCKPIGSTIRQLRTVIPIRKYCSEDYYFKSPIGPIRVAWFERQKSEYFATLLLEEKEEIDTKNLEGPYIIPRNPCISAQEHVDLITSDGGIFEALSCLYWREPKRTSLLWFSKRSSLITQLLKCLRGCHYNMTIVYYGDVEFNEKAQDSIVIKNRSQGTSYEDNVLAPLLQDFWPRAGLVYGKTSL
jgi:hypothetical protein